MHRFRRRPSPALVIACIALFVALTGTGVAASTLVLPRNSVGPAQLKADAVTSAKVRDGSLSRADLAASALVPGPAGPAGAAGAPGEPGKNGEPGPSDAFAGYIDAAIPLPESFPGVPYSTITTLAVPLPGTYVLAAKLWARNTGQKPATATCELVAGADLDVARGSVDAPTVSSVSPSASLALTVVHEFPAAGTVVLRCSGHGQLISANNIKITAIRVGSLTNSAIKDAQAKPGAAAERNRAGGS